MYIIAQTVFSMEEVPGTYFSFEVYLLKVWNILLVIIIHDRIFVLAKQCDRKLFFLMKKLFIIS